MLIELAVGIPIIFLLFYIWWTRNYNHWQNKGVPCLNPSFPYGNIQEIFFIKTTVVDFLQNIYDKFPNDPLVGFYSMRQPMVVVRDLELIREVLVKEFNSFADGGMQCSEKHDPMTALNPFLSKGQNWKIMRGIQSQAHTASKIRGMIPVMYKTTKNVIKYVHEQKGKELNINEIGRHYAVDTVVGCAYGTESDSFFTNDNAFLNNTEGQLFTGNNSGPLASIFYPWLARITGARVVSKLAEKFFINLVNTVMDQRKKNNITGHDLIQQLIVHEEKALKEGTKRNVILCTTFRDIEKAAILVTFFLDGTETASIEMSYVIFQIASYPEVQKRLREEIKSVGSSIDDFDYDKIWSLEYLEMVIAESLRLHPIIAFLSRVCTETTNLGGYQIDKGTKLFIPMYALHHDPQYHPNPKEFVPERFSKENKASIVKYTYLPFGEGPRICIGARYAQTQMKAAIISLLLNFQLSLGQKHTPGKIPYDDKMPVIIMPKGDIWVKFEPLST